MCHQLNLADFTDNHWVTCFQDTAEQILGKKADELGELKDQVSYSSYAPLGTVLAGLTCSYLEQ